MKHALRTASLWLLPLALAGCALNQLRIEEATDVAAKGKIAVAAARDYLGKVAAAREAMNLEYVGLDPVCRPDTAHLRFEPELKKGVEIKALPPGWLCSPTPIPGKTVELPLGPPARELQPTLRMLEGLSTYFAAITEIVEEPGPTTSADILETLAVFRSAATLAGAVSGTDGALGVPTDDDGRVKSVLSLITFLETLRTEAEKVKDLRKLVAKNDKAGTLMSDMRNRLSTWEFARKVDAITRTANSRAMIETAWKAGPPAAAEVRQQLVRNYYARAAAQIDDAKLFPALDGTLEALIDADTAMRNALEENPNLDARQRARLAQLTRKRVAAAFDALAGVLIAFAKG